MAYIVGIDEAGRGPWAGPMTVCAAKGVVSKKFDDSKKLSAQQRAELYLEVVNTSIQIELVWVSSKQIDIHGLSQCLYSAVEQLASRFEASDHFIIDGSIDYLKDLKLSSQAIVKADGKVAEVSAASIVAKVSRDNFMAGYIDNKFPDYGFARHKGYGTATHLQALNAHGVTSCHRLSFKPIRELLDAA